MPLLDDRIAGRKIVIARGEGKHLQMRALAIGKEWNPPKTSALALTLMAAPPGHSRISSRSPPPNAPAS